MQSMTAHIGVKFLIYVLCDPYDSTSKFSKMDIAESGVSVGFLRRVLLLQLRDRA
jgi:hypothetical protein